MNDRIRQGKRVSMLGLVFSAVLATLKLLTGLIGRSDALIADAVESFADMASSAIVWGGLAISAKPPDENHPYGHGKAETLAAMLVGLMLLSAAAGVAVGAVQGIATPQPPPEKFTLIVLVMVVVAKEAWFQIAARVGKRIESTALHADAWHHRSDAMTSLLAFVGIALSIYSGPAFLAAEDWAALIASAIIAWNGWRFIKRAGSELMDQQPDASFLSEVNTTAQSVSGVELVEKLMARKMGTAYLVDMHVEVNSRMTVHDAHELAHLVKDTVCAKHANVADVLVHIEPHEP